MSDTTRDRLRLKIRDNIDGNLSLVQYRGFSEEILTSEVQLIDDLEQLIQSEVLAVLERLKSKSEAHYLVDEGGYEQEREFTTLVPLSALEQEKQNYAKQ